MSKENKQILKKYQKNYRDAKKSKSKFFFLTFFLALYKNEKNLDFW